jgi:hypothetical protein
MGEIYPGYLQKLRKDLEGTNTSDKVLAALSFVADSELERKGTNSSTSDSIVVLGENVLNSYTSYTYNFTLAVLKNEVLKRLAETPLRPGEVVNFNNSDYFTIAKSGGKGSAGLDVSNAAKIESRVETENGSERIRGTAVKAYTLNQERKSLIESFNQESAGRFDFYIDNVKIKILGAGNEKTNMSISTNVDFELFESYSMTGFIEALHVATLAAGHKSYIEAPVMLKMEFKGYKDSDPVGSNPEIIPNSTRYFVFRFTGIDITVTEQGTKYSCKGIPFNEYAQSTPGTLPVDISLKGTDVQSILENFFDNLNKAYEKSAKDTDNEGKFDTYSVVFPQITKDGVDLSYIKNPKNYTRNDISKNIVNTLWKSDTVYAFPDEDQPSANTNNDEEQTVDYNPSDSAFKFSQGATVTDCIASIVRDSGYLKKLLQNPEPNELGFVDYFFIHAEVEKRDGRDEKNNKDLYHYRFIVIPYKIHYTRLNPRSNCPINTKKIKQSVHRAYNYFYTGKNLDIIKFDLQFNTLYFQAVPYALGNIPGRPRAYAGIEPDPQNQSASKDDCNVDTAIGTPQTLQVVQNETVSGMENAKFTSSDPYDYLAKNLHQAILENVDQVKLQVEILGDPYYLVTTGMGNIKNPISPDGTAGQGEAPMYFQDFFVNFKFRNPIDINIETGFAQFDNRLALYSGLFRVINIENIFSEGVFKQNLECIRLPMQPEDTQVVEDPIEVSPIGLIGTPDPTSIPTPTPPLQTGLKPTDGELVATILDGTLPTPGAPAELSALIPASSSVAGPGAGDLEVGNLTNLLYFGNFGTIPTGAVSAIGQNSAVGSLVSQTQGPITQGLANVARSLRLSKSGLSGLSEKINSSGGQVSEIFKTLTSVGSKLSISDIAKTLSEFTNDPDNLGTQAMSKVNSLSGNSAGLVSGVSSKISSLSGKAVALSSELGIDLSRLIGLSPDLQSKVIDKINNAASKIPDSVDVTALVKKGFLLNNIPVSKLENIPPSQPNSVASNAISNVSDLQEIVAQGGNLRNFSGISQAEIAKTNFNLSRLTQNIVANQNDSSVLSQKISSVQQSVNIITNRNQSVESRIAEVQSISRAQIPNTTQAPASVINVYNNSLVNESPLTKILNSLRN